jgi:integrase
MQGSTTWGLTQEKQKSGITTFVIKRWDTEKKRPVRLPVQEYAHIRDDEKELREFVKRLNAPLSAQRKVEFRHAFINEALLEKYLKYLKTQIATQSVAITNFNYLKKYVLGYFIGQCDLMDPNDWTHIEHQTNWGDYLLNHKEVRAAKTKRTIVSEANRFLYWLAEMRGKEVRYKKMQPLTKSQLKTVEAVRILKGENSQRKLIPDDHWKRIEANLPAHLMANANLGYHYGLRRSETLGVQVQNVKLGYLRLERQLIKIGVYGPLKGKLARKVDHWFTSVKNTHKWVKVAEANPMHPTTLSTEWAEFMKSLGYDYDFHDLRHTFITKAVRKHNVRDVQLAAGHKHISVTMGYLHDDRTQKDETYVPDEEE